MPRKAGASLELFGFSVLFPDATGGPLENPEDDENPLVDGVVLRRSGLREAIVPLCLRARVRRRVIRTLEFIVVVYGYGKL